MSGADEMMLRAMVLGYRSMLDRAISALHEIENEAGRLDEAREMAHEALDEIGVPA